jgi:hypothetical protein
VRDYTFKSFRAGALAALVAASAIVGSVGGDIASAQPVLPTRPVPLCTPLRGPGPGYNATIGNAQNGKQVCITLGQKLLVFLTVPPTSGLKWHPIQASPPGVLSIAPLTLMLSRGVTAQNFIATHTGVAHLSSERMACSPPPKSQVECGAMVSWRATVLVRPAPSPHY